MARTASVMYTHSLSSKRRPVIVVHGGTSSRRRLDEGCVAAADAARPLAAAGSDAIEVAVAAVVALEDDGRFNAGSGAVSAMDGVTVEMDAAVMDSQDRLGAVAAVRDVKNPVRVAREVANSPHWLIAGEGALRFARAVGLTEPHEVSPRRPQREATAAMLDAARFWNFPSPRPRTGGGRGSDTVGAVVRDGSGQFAAAASTGGLSNKLLGRVGDTPAIGCGFYAGAFGAFAVTGIGERIVRTQLAFRLHQWVESGVPLGEALQRGLALFAAGVDVGVIGVTSHAAAVCANRDMAFASIEC